MEIGKYKDGRALTYDEAKKTFAVGGTPVSVQQVQEYDRFNQIAWISEEWQAWARNLDPKAAATSSGSLLGDQLKGLQWWHVLLGLLFLPFTILLLIFLMWKRELFEKPARVALSVVGAIVALGILATAIPDAGTAPVEERRVASQQESEPEAEPPAVEPTSTEEPAPESAYPKVTVSRVIDGDTAEVTYEDGKVEKVRFIGVDTPESTNQVEPYGKEASAYTKRELEGKTVYLETDAELRDKYGRLLAYVWLAEPPPEPSTEDIRTNLFNARLLLAGFAQLLTIPPNTKYVDTYTGLQEEARNEQAGLWAPPKAEPKPAPAPAPEPEPEPEPAPKPKSPSRSNVTVYITKTGEKYHRDGCRYLAKSKIPISLEDAKAGYDPCSVCDPPQ